VSTQPIKNDDELRITLLRVDEIWGAEKGTPDGDELELLIALVSDYEDGLIIKKRCDQSEVQLVLTTYSYSSMILYYLKLLCFCKYSSFSMKLYF